MADAHLDEFYGRIARIEKARAKGYGFEAAGTLGRSFYAKRFKKQHKSVLTPVVMVLCCAVGMKGLIHAKIGGQVYDERIATLAQGEGFERIGAYLMSADPMTIFVSKKIRDNLI